jgi:hypothetical protein
MQTHYSENLIAPGIEPGTSGSVARNSDHYTTEAVLVLNIQAINSSETSETFYQTTRHHIS